MPGAGTEAHKPQLNDTTRTPSAFGTLMAAARQQHRATAAMASGSALPAADPANAAHDRPDSFAQLASAGLHNVKQRVEAPLFTEAPNSDAAPGPSVFQWDRKAASNYQGIFTRWVRDPSLAQQQPDTYVRVPRSVCADLLRIKHVCSKIGAAPVREHSGAIICVMVEAE